jgi:hypothetical protein
MKTKRHQPSTASLALLRQTLRLSARANAWLTISFVAATLLFVIIVGSTVQPDFWTVRSLVGFQGNAWLFAVVSYVAFLPFSFTPYWLMGAVQAAGLVLRDQALIFLPQLQRLWQQSLRFVAQALALVLARRESVLTELQLRQPQLSPKSKAPILLFGRAALLLAP